MSPKVVDYSRKRGSPFIARQPFRQWIRGLLLCKISYRTSDFMPNETPNKARPCDTLLPEWPRTDDFAICGQWELSANFKFSHRASFDSESKVQTAPADPFFLFPSTKEGSCISGRIQHFFKINEGGSLLVSGYRGTGKSSIVNHALDKCCNREDIVKVNLSTATKSTEVMALLIRRLIAQFCGEDKTGQSFGWHEQLESLRLRLIAGEYKVKPPESPSAAWDYDIDSTTSIARETLSECQHELAKLVMEIQNLTAIARAQAVQTARATLQHELKSLKVDKTRVEKLEEWIKERTEGSNKATASEQQASLKSIREIIEKLEESKPATDCKTPPPTDPCAPVIEAAKNLENALKGNGRIVIVYDELDKLVGDPTKDKPDRPDEKPGGLAVLERIVAELKLFFTESGCFHVFIAGKDADDRWEEDKGKGRGILESVFSSNIEIPSLFSTHLAGETDKAIAALGIGKSSISFNTAKLVLSRFHSDVVGRLASRTRLVKILENRAKDVGDYNVQASELEVRELRAFIHYLTYKGRGIPRKILREMYHWVRPCVIPKDGKASEADPKSEITIARHDIQRMTFYAAIVEHLDRRFTDFWVCSDKAKVSVFHIIDYILKFYETGFTRQDIEHANFMTTREELFPGRDVVGGVIHALEGRYIRPKDRRSAEYRIVPGTVADLRRLHLRYGHEQTELRHTQGEFENEIKRLQGLVMKESDMSNDGERKESAITLIRLAQIFEHLGRHQDARMTYGKAMRWIRQALTKLGADRADFHSKVATMMSPLRCDFGEAYVATYVSYGAAVQQRLGYLEERLEKYQEALVFYRGAIELHKSVSQAVRDLRTKKCPENPTKKTTKIAYVLNEMGIACGTPEYQIINGSDFSIGLTLNEYPNEPDGYVHSLNHAAFACEKMGDRASSNQYLVDGLAYSLKVSDEFGAIEQIVLIGQMLFCRRDFKLALECFYVGAQKCVELMTSNATTDKWATPGPESVVFAQIMTAIGDIQTATGGIGVRKTADGPPDWERLEGILCNKDTEKENKPGIADRDHETDYAYLYAMVLSESAGDENTTIETGVRALEHRATFLAKRLRDAQKEDAQKEARELAQYDVIRMWRSFWNTLATMLFKVLIADEESEKELTDRWGIVARRRHIGNLMRLAGEVFMDMAILPEPTNPQHSIRAVIVKKAQDEAKTEAETAAKVESDPRVQLYTKLICGSESAEDIPAFNTIGESRLKGHESSLHDPERILRATLVAAEKIISIFAWISDRPDEAISGVESSEVTAIVGIQSPLWGIGGTVVKKDDPSYEGFLGQKLKKLLFPQETESTEEEAKAKEEAEAKEKAMAKEEAMAKEKAKAKFTLLALTEKAQIVGYLHYRDCLPDSGYGHLCLDTGKNYLRMLYLWLSDGLNDKPASVEKRTEVERSEEKTDEMKAVRDDLLRCLVRKKTNEAMFCEIRSAAESFLKKALNILQDGLATDTFALQIAAEVHFNLGDLALIEWASTIWAEVKLNDDTGSAPSPPTLPENAIKAFVTPPTGKDQYPLMRQILHHYQQGIQMIMREIDIHQARYPLPHSVQYAHRNITDQDAQFRIAKAASVRFSPESVKTHKEITGMITELAHKSNHPTQPYIERKEWLKFMIRMFSVIETYSLRTDRVPIKITDQGIEWVPPSNLPESKCMALFSKAT